MTPKAESPEPSLPVDPTENVIMRQNRQYWAPRRRGGWRAVTPMSESEIYSRETRGITFMGVGATAIFISWFFPYSFEQWPWSPLVGLVAGLVGAAALIAGIVLFVRQRRFVAFVVPVAGDLFGMAQHLDGLPKLIDLDAADPQGAR